MSDYTLKFIEDLSGYFEYKVKVEKHYERYIIILDKEEKIPYEVFRQIQIHGYKVHVSTHKRFELQIWDE